jgi:hypothetical protein
MKTLKGGLVIGIALATAAAVQGEVIYGISSENEILSFDSASPSVLINSRALTGLEAGEFIRALDYDAVNGTLFGVGSSSRLYAINPTTGAATAAGSQFTPLLNGTTFGMAYDAASSQFRVVSDLDQNLTINQAVGGISAVGPNVAYAAGDPNFGVNPVVNALAYSGATLYALDSTLNILATFDAGTGGVTTRGPLGVDVSRFNGFDVSPFTGTGYVGSPATSGGLAADLWTINLATGQLTLVGHIGDIGDNYLLRGMVVVPEPSTTVLMSLAGFAMLAYIWRRRA